MLKPATTLDDPSRRPLAVVVDHSVKHADRKSPRLPKTHRSGKAFSRLLRRADSNRRLTEGIACLRDAIMVTAIGNKKTHGGTVIALSGPKGEEGTSLISLLLALSLGSCTNRRIAWIDGSFHPERFAALCEVLRLSPSSIKFRKGVSELTSYSNESRPNVAFFRNSTEEKTLGFFSDQRLGRFLSELQHEFDFTVIDMPPVMREASNFFLMPLVDHFYLVGVPRETSMSELHKCISAARQAGGEVSGVILNKQRIPIWSHAFWKDFFVS